MCVGCHGAPNTPPSEIADGLNPNPPELANSKKTKPPTELYWIVKNGIKMTGMPAFGPTHTEEELWAIVAFLKKLPELSQDEYQAMDKEAEGMQQEHNQDNGHNHEHHHEHTHDHVNYHIHNDNGHTHDH